MDTRVLETGGACQNGRLMACIIRKLAERVVDTYQADD